jgi:hypothetical protein
MSKGRRIVAVSFTAFRAVVVAVCLFRAAPALAADHYALIVTGASGGPEYADRYRSWRQIFVRALGEFNYPSDRVFILEDHATGNIRPATAAGVRAAFAELQRRVTADDTLIVLLIGHGVADGSAAEDAKFNLVGPDLSASDWLGLVAPIQGRVVFINAASGSFPFLRKMAGKNRVVVSAAASPAQQYETIFPEFFVSAFAGLAGDTDKNGKVSIWEAFNYASDRVTRWFAERGQLQTERAMLDDNGDGVGREARSEGPDGALAAVTYLQPSVTISEPADTVLGVLLRRRAALETSIEQLRAKKPSLAPADYDAQLETLMLEMARLDRQIRAEKSKN